MPLIPWEVQCQGGWNEGIGLWAWEEWGADIRQSVTTDRHRRWLLLRRRVYPVSQPQVVALDEVCRNSTTWSSPLGDEWGINVFVDSFPFPVLPHGEVHLQDTISLHSQGCFPSDPLAVAEKWDLRVWYFIWSGEGSQWCWPFTSSGEPVCHKGSRWVGQAPEIWERDEAGGFQAGPTMCQYRHGKHQSDTKEEERNKFPFHCRPSSHCL